MAHYALIIQPQVKPLKKYVNNNIIKSNFRRNSQVFNSLATLHIAIGISLPSNRHSFRCLFQRKV